MNFRRIPAVMGSLAVCSILFGSAGLDAQQDPIPLDSLTVRVESRLLGADAIRTRAVEVIDANTLRSLPVRTVSEALRWTLGADVKGRSPAQTDLSIRGSGFEQILLLVDGVRMSDVQTGHFDFDLAVPLDQVERVEILRGSASALYGADALGGVVNIVTRKASDTTFHAGVEGGSDDLVGVSLSAGTSSFGGGSVSGAAEFDRSTGHRPGTDYEVRTGRIRYDRPVGGGDLVTDVGYGRRDFGANRFYSSTDSYEETRTLTASASWRGLVGSGVVLQPRVAIRTHDDDFVFVRSNPSARNRHRASQSGGELIARSVPSEGVQWAVGGEVYRDRLRSNNLGSRLEVRGALFTEVVWTPLAEVVLTGGVRNDWHNVYGDAFSPSMSAAWTVSEGVTLRGAAGRSFRAPTWVERYIVFTQHTANPDLEPERAWSGEVGVDWTGDRLQASVTGFYRDVSNVIDWSRPAGLGDAVDWVTRNVESAQFTGIELDLRGEGPLETRWSVGGTVLSLDSADGEGFESKSTLRPLTEQVQASVGKAFTDRAHLDLRATHARRRSEGAYTTVDARLRYRVRDADLYLDVTNVLDRRYPDPNAQGVAAPGRALVIGWSYGRGG